jgi:hypothetical protein
MSNGLLIWRLRGGTVKRDALAEPE